MGTRCRPVRTVVQQGEIESIPASSYESTIVHCVFRGMLANRIGYLRQCFNITIRDDDDDDDDDDLDDF
ncbi:hypothetical protein ANN_02478 [Periplaneta americana]|uniref:Per a allergen n=1 Tax=Periplaneta americana TaxID=6978 RepID=A0ABQ8TY56_PERAM|nr:hypothetical protein ANN_02478 [Periplaneta americana]